MTYRRVFATPGLRSLLVLGLLGKVPGIGVPAVLLVQVVQGLGLGFGPASVVSAAWTLGAGVGAPFQGRAMDRYGLRPLIAVVVLAQVAFWGFAPLLPYPLLVVAALGGGLLNVPAFTVVRLGLAVLVEDDIRHTAYVAGGRGGDRDLRLRGGRDRHAAAAGPADLDLGGAGAGRCRLDRGRPGVRRAAAPAATRVLAVALGTLVLPIGFADHWAWLCVLAIPANLLIAPALSATADAVSRIAPAGSKGRVTGAARPTPVE